jgi:hypothetical protein
MKTYGVLEVHHHALLRRKLAQAVTLVAYMREVSGSNLGRNIKYPVLSPGFSPFLQENSVITYSIRSRSLASTPFSNSLCQ